MHERRHRGRDAFIDSLMDTELYSIGAFFSDEHPDLADEVVARTSRSRAAASRRTRETTGAARGDVRDAAHRPRGPLLQGGGGLCRADRSVRPWDRESAAERRRRADRRCSCRSRSARAGLGRGLGGVNDVQRIFGGIAQEGDLELEDAELRSTSSTTSSACRAPTIIDVSTRWSRTTCAPTRRGSSSATTAGAHEASLAAIAAEAAAEQARQWQYLDTFFRNQDLAIRDVDEDVLREVAEAEPQLDLEQWEHDYESSRADSCARTRCRGRSLPPSRPSSSTARRQRELIESPSAAGSRRRSKPSPS